MSGEFIYTRKYIIFKDEYSNIQGLNPKGHGLLEVRENKGKISINVERSQGDYYYNAYLVGDNGENIVETFIGKVITDDVGKGFVELGFNPRNVAESNFSIERYNSLVLRRGANILLVGHIKGNRSNLKKYLLNIQDEEYEEYNEEIVEEIVEEVVEEVVEENVEVIEEYSYMNKDTLEVEEAVELKEVEETEVEEAVEELSGEKEDIVEELLIEDIFEEIEEVDVANNDQEAPFVYPVNNGNNGEYTNFKSQMIDYVLSILRFFPYIKPFNIELNGYDWWKIESDGGNIHRGFLPFYNYLLNMYYEYPHSQNTVTCKHLIQKYGNYLFGMYRVEDDVQYYIYGVPGRFNTLEHPFRGATGFNTWYETADGLGYWLLYIDPMTGKILFPINPMIPTY